MLDNMSVLIGVVCLQCVILCLFVVVFLLFLIFTFCVWSQIIIVYFTLSLIR